MASIREARLEDFEELWRIDQECFASGIAYSRKELAFCMSAPRAFTLVAELQAQLSGFVVAQAQREHFGHILTIDVRPAARRAKLGSKLLAAAEARLHEESCKTVSLETAVNNASALAFYKQHGYSVQGTIPRYYLNSIDALVLHKRLDGALPGRKTGPSASR